MIEAIALIADLARQGREALAGDHERLARPMDLNFDTRRGSTT